MAPRRKARPLQTAEEWQVPATQRLTDRAIERGHTFTGINEESLNALATRPLSRLAAAEPIAADEGTQPRTGTQAAMLWHRTGLEGQRPAKFAPQQCSVMVEGRPVQVVVGLRIHSPMLSPFSHHWFVTPFTSNCVVPFATQ